MAAITEILEFEANRDGQEMQRFIHLFQEGSFYRAYEWSAWLMCRYLHEFKVRIYDVRYGVDFLGGFIKPYRNYISNATLHRMERKLPTLQNDDPERLDSRINSLLGVLSHYSSLKLQRRLFHPSNLQRHSGKLVFDGRKFKWSALRQ